MAEETKRDWGDERPKQEGGWLIREILRLYTYPFVLIAWLVVPWLMLLVRRPEASRLAFRDKVMRYMRGSVMIWKVFVDPFRESNEEARETAVGAEGNSVDRKVFIVLITSALCITCLEYFGMSNRYTHVTWTLNFLGFEDAAAGFNTWMMDQLNRLTYWAVACVTCYFVIPSFVIVVVLREKLTDYGLGIAGALKDTWIYVLFFGTVLPALIFVSFDPHFQATYPFYDPPPGESLWPRFWMWELLYLAQFFALEFFFRGFMVHGTRQRLGYYAVAVMMVPYCMIHFGKPMPETLGAIIAGIVLGSLSLKARSIWLGVAIHGSVALTMDFASLAQTGRFLAENQVVP